MNKRIMITGINGLLGQNIVKAFQPDYDIYGIDLNPSIYDDGQNINMRELNLTELDVLRTHIAETSPDVMVHTAAYTNVDRAEDESALAFKVNADVPQGIADICQDLNIPLIHISTDYVFSGLNGPYDESADCDARGKYAESKLAGEQAVLKSSGRVAVIRPNVLYGEGKQLTSSFVDWLVNELKANRSVRIVDDQFNNPTYARRLADVIRIVFEKEAWGIWHFGSKEVVSRYTFALNIADTFGLSSALINAISTVDLNQKAPRPMRSGLICEKMKNELGVPILSIGEELALLKDEMNVT